MPQDKRPLKVFLCHAHADRATVRTLYSRLKREGVDAWLDKEKLLPGSDWELEIRKAVREADVVVVCLSKQFNQAGFRQKEVRLALDTAMQKPEGEIFIIPARLEECDSLDSLGKWHWVDLFEADGYQSLIRALRARADKIGATLRIRGGRQAPVSHPQSKESENKTEPIVIVTGINEALPDNALGTEVWSTPEQEKAEQKILDTVAHEQAESEVGERVKVDEFARPVSKENVDMLPDSIEKVISEEKAFPKLKPAVPDNNNEFALPDKKLITPQKTAPGSKPGNAKPAPKRKLPFIAMGVVTIGVLGVLCFFSIYLYNFINNANKSTFLPLQDYFEPGNVGQLDLDLSGQATNETSHKASGITLHIKSDDGVNYSASGSFDRITLFGNFETTGSRVACESDGVICLQFSGKIYFGDNDGSGFPSGTETSFEMYLTVNQNSMTGTYVIGKIPDSNFENLEQNGTLSVLLASAILR